MKKLLFSGTLVAIAVVAAMWSAGTSPTLSVPSGFEITVFAEGLEGVRSLAVGPDEMLYAVLSRAGRVVRLDPLEERAVETVVGGLEGPYGIAFHGGWMYIAETHRVTRSRAPLYEGPEIVVPHLPAGPGHWTREIVFGADDMLYVAVGSSCDVCEESDPRRASVVRYRPDGSDETIVAEGLRNSAGLAVHPEDGTIWASVNERDLLGDDLPADEINVLSDGGHFGWPYCYGHGVTDPAYRDRGDFCRTATPPALEIPAHSAPLGMVFYTAEQFPAEYRGDLFVALHGSWTRAEGRGYEIIRVRVDGGRPTSYEQFATGWLSRGRVHGRPVGTEVGPDGSLYVADDEGGRVYRIRWVGEAG